MQDALNTLKPTWKHYRVVHSKYPTVNIFCNDDLQNLSVCDIENLTSQRSILELTNSQMATSDTNLLRTPQDVFVDSGDIKHGPGWGAVMASFAYPRYGRYSTDSQGAYYCSDSLRASLSEWAHHTRKYWVDEMNFTSEVSAVVRCYTGNFKKDLLDARNRPDLMTEDYDANHRFLAAALMLNSYGILYDSMRYSGALCAAILRPSATTEVTQAGHYAIMFNGDKFTDYSKLGRFYNL